MLGFYITGHPLDEHRDKVAELATHRTSELEGLAKNTEVVLCGILTGIQRKRNKEGKQWAALQIEDLEGSVESMVFSTQYDRLLPLLNEDKAVMVRGLVLPEENAPPKISVQDVVLLGKRPRAPAFTHLDSCSVNRSRSQRATDADAPTLFPNCSPESPARPKFACAWKSGAISRLSWTYRQGPAGQGILRRARADLRTGSTGGSRERMSARDQRR
jgi:DNA polymerase III alpha subunit